LGDNKIFPWKIKMIFKKNFSYLIISLIYLTSFNIIKADEFDDEIDAETECANVENPVTHEPKKNISNIDVLSQLLAIGIPQFLECNLYLKTNTVLKRPVNSLSIFNLYHTDNIHQSWLFNILLFGNKTDRAFFTDSSEFIKSYIFLNNPQLLNVLKNFDFDSKKLINIVKNAKKEERRGGFIFQALKNFDDWSFEFSLPVIYEERNYFFTPEEKEKLEDFFGNRPEKQEEKLYRKHAISDKLGIDDARIKIGYPIIKEENICTQFGLQLTIPIAFAFKKGLLGSDFMRATDVRPSFSFKNAIELQDTNPKELKAFGEKFGLQALDWLSAMVLDAPLGNGGHFGLGAFIEPQIKLNEGVTLKALSSIEYFFSAKEKRFYLKKKNPADFAKSKFDEALESEAAATKAVSFLNEQLVDTLFPPMFLTDVTPGFIFQITAGPRFRIREWDLYFGYDFWFQHEEKINHIHTSLNNLLVNKSIKHRALSNKIFGKLTYNRIKTTHDWCFSLCVEDSLSSKGIGKDYSVSAGFEINY
jgi:hypothetical protein